MFGHAFHGSSPSLCVHPKAEHYGKPTFRLSSSAHEQCTEIKPDRSRRLRISVILLARCKKRSRCSEHLSSRTISFNIARFSPHGHAHETRFVYLAQDATLFFAASLAVSFSDYLSRPAFCTVLLYYCILLLHSISLKRSYCNRAKYVEGFHSAHSTINSSLPMFPERSGTTSLTCGKSSYSVYSRMFLPFSS